MKFVKLAQILDFQKKSHIKAGDGLKEGSFPFFTSSPVLSKYSSFSQFNLPSLIFGTGGKASVHVCKNPFSVSTDCLVAQLKTDLTQNFEIKFIYYYLFGNIWILEKGFRGAGLEHISKGYINNIDIPELPFEDQKRIVKILDEVDSLRQKRKQAINLLDEYLKSVFLEMFGDPMKNEKGWKASPLGKYLKVKHGFAFKSEYFLNKGSFILLTPGNFYEQGGYKDRGEKQKYYIGDFPKSYILSKNDLLVAMTEQAPGLLGSLIFIPESNKFLHNQRLGLIIYDKVIVNRFFIFYLFNHPKIRKIIYTKATGTKVRHTSPTKLEAINIALPPIALQNQFAIIVEKTEYTKQKMLAQSEEMEKQFQGLMQSNFSQSK
ncbi:MAG: hypothetical protein ACD_12C00887G0003 [uncultured bacterium]|nr:MAG: hypothetical protein ACD_12C00887G0003 [uncultured bacterium]